MQSNFLPWPCSDGNFRERRRGGREGSSRGEPRSTFELYEASAVNGYISLIWEKRGDVPKRPVCTVPRVFCESVDSWMVVSGLPSGNATLRANSSEVKKGLGWPFYSCGNRKSNPPRGSVLPFLRCMNHSCPLSRLFLANVSLPADAVQFCSDFLRISLFSPKMRTIDGNNLITSCSFNLISVFVHHYIIIF